MNSIEEKLRNGVKESLRQRFKERRSNLEIMADILSVAMSGAVKTEIVYRANLNFTRLKVYLAYLEACGLLENSGPSFIQVLGKRERISA
jgi:predicted transcriptional regulator